MGFGGAGAVHAADEAPDAMVQRLSTEVLDALRADKSIKAGDLDKVIALVDKTIMPNVNFRRMTAAVGSGLAQGQPRAAKAAAGRIQDPAGAHLCRCLGAGERPDGPTSSRCGPVRRTRMCWCARRCGAEGSDTAGLLAGKTPARGPAGRSTTSTFWGLAGGNLPQPVCPGNQRQRH